MSWNAIGALGEVGGAIAVLATLVYLTLQIRQSNQQRQIEVLRHIQDSMSQCCDLVARSRETASIIIRGRESPSSLEPDEQLVFHMYHQRMFNTIEIWHRQISRVATGELADQQIRNIADVIETYLTYPGCRELWRESRHMFEPNMVQLMDSKMGLAGEADASSRART